MLCPFRCLALFCLAAFAMILFPAASAGEAEPSDRPPSPPASLIAERPSRTPVSQDNRISPADSGPSILVLRTGGVLQGRIERDADFFTVTRGRGELQIRARDVEFVCRDLSEAYTMKRAAMFGGAVDEHIHLAEWCLRHELTQYAAREVLDARGIDSRHPRLEAVERRLAWATRPKKPPSPARPGRSAVVQAAYNESVTEKRDRAGNGLPALVTVSVVETFTNSIQPLLLNSCTNGGCHQIGGREAYQLDRLVLRRASGRRTTLKNLEATLHWIDAKTPEESRLLIEAHRAHGTQTIPPLSGRRAALYEKLAAWVQEVGGEREMETSDNNSEGSDGPRPAPFGMPSETTADSPVALNPAEHPIRRGAVLRARQPKDAFDPEQFNRQMHE